MRSNGPLHQVYIMQELKSPNIRTFKASLRRAPRYRLRVPHPMPPPALFELGSKALWKVMPREKHPVALLAASPERRKPRVEYSGHRNTSRWTTRWVIAKDSQDAKNKNKIIVQKKSYRVYDRELPQNMIWTLSLTARHRHGKGNTDFPWASLVQHLSHTCPSGSQLLEVQSQLSTTVLSLHQT